MRLTTAMNSPTASVTGTAPSDTNCHTSSTGRGGNGRPRSRHLSRRATIYCQINEELIRGVDGSPVGQPHVENGSIRNNLKQFSKVGYEDAKTWMERRLAGMKNGVPVADAAGLSREWASSGDADILRGSRNCGHRGSEPSKTICKVARSINWADGTNTAQWSLQNYGRATK
jgi:hypothetical protein